MQVRTKAAGAAIIAALAGGIGAQGAHAAAKPDLKIKKVTAAAATAAPGARLQVRDTVANGARKRARKSKVGYWLSADRRRGGADVKLGTRKQKPLRGRRKARGRRTLTIPAVIAPGAYHVIACADASRKLKERRERNNCRASKRAITVAPLPPAPPDGSAPSPDSGAGGTGQFPLPANPLTVSHELDENRAVTRRLENYGGTMSATAADGTKYTLTMPSGALVSGADITMTPVQAVAGSPLSGGLIGAVQLEPHGLELLKPATLKIEPAGDAGPVAGQTGFLSHEAGEDFHLYPLGMGGELTMSLMHFSTPGVAQATDADRQVVLGHPPERHRAQYEQMAAAIIQDAREAGEQAPFPSDELAQVLRGYYDDIVWPLVEQALTDDTVASRAISELLGWARQVQLMSLQDHTLLKVRHDAVTEYLIAILENAVNKGYDRCVNDHDLDFIVRLIGLARVAQLLGLELGHEALDKAQRCANFELEFDSLITHESSNPEGEAAANETSGRWHVRSPGIPIDITGIGQGTFEWHDFAYDQTTTSSCSNGGKLIYVTTGTATQPDATVTAFLGMDLNLREPGTPPPADRDIRVRLFHYDDVKETYRTENTSWCGDAPSSPTEVVESRWRGHYDLLHVDEYLTGMRAWTLGSGDLVASKGYIRSVTNRGLTESTTVELWHRPLR